MKLTQLLIAGGLAASLALPLAASAQQAPQPQSGYPQQSTQPYQQGQRPAQTTPSVDRLQQRFARMLGNLNVSGQQQAQITGMINQFAQTHPAGSPVDRAGAKELRQQILAVLTPAQQAQFQQEMAAKRAARMQQHQQRMQEQQQQQQQPQQQPQQQQPPMQPQGQPQPPN